VPADAVPSADQVRAVNVRYHDLAAAHYDSKWGISYDAVGQAQVAGKLRKALGAEPGHYPHALEIGAGTGYFGLNLVRAGIVDRLTSTDISPGMLDVLSGTASELGIEVDTAACEAAELPFEDESVDLVFGHAVLHHLPDLGGAFAEFERVLRPGGVVAFCGEPSHYGDRLASVPKRAALAVAPAWRALMRAGQRVNGHAHGQEEDQLEAFVDVHAFTPHDLAVRAQAAGLQRVRVSGEELAAGLFGWANRTLESTADPDQVPVAWRQYAYRGYLLLQRVDRSLLEPRLPAALFYNLLLSAHKPA
jgi:ubiquinone/menaquinone biosynthesis C-methylase UbiE